MKQQTSWTQGWLPDQKPVTSKAARKRAQCASELGSDAGEAGLCKRIGRGEG